MKDLPKLFTKCLLLFIPVFSVYSFPLVVLSMAGELTSIDRVLQRQAGAEPVLFGLAYSNPAKHYKFQGVLEKNPQVLVLGTSRAMQFRKEFFHGDVRFYNAGGGVSRVAHLAKFLRHIPEGKEPKIIIVGLDQNFFNPNWDDFKEDFVERDFAETKTPIEIIQDSFRKIYVDYYEDKFTLRQLLSRKDDVMGLTATVNGNGFRNDGSYFNSEELHDLQYNPETMRDYRSRQTLGYIEQGADRYVYGQEVSSRALEYLREFLSDAKARDIHVIGFLPPYRRVVMDKIRSMPIEYEYFFKLQDALTPLFKEFSFGFYDFSEISKLGASDAYFIDGDHGSDKAYLMLFSEMVKNEKQLRTYSDPVALKSILENSQGISLTF